MYGTSMHMYSTLHTGTRVWHTCIALRATGPHLSALRATRKKNLTRSHSYASLLPSTLIPPSRELSHHKSQRLIPPHIFLKSTPAPLSLPGSNIGTTPFLSPFLRVLFFIGLLHLTSILQVGGTSLGSLPQPLSVRSV